MEGRKKKRRGPGRPPKRAANGRYVSNRKRRLSGPGSAKVQPVQDRAVDWLIKTTSILGGYVGGTWSANEFMMPTDPTKTDYSGVILAVAGGLVAIMVPDKYVQSIGTGVCLSGLVRLIRKQNPSLAGKMGKLGCGNQLGEPKVLKVWKPEASNAAAEAAQLVQNLRESENSAFLRQNPLPAAPEWPIVRMTGNQMGSVGTSATNLTLGPDMRVYAVPSEDCQVVAIEEMPEFQPNQPFQTLAM